MNLLVFETSASTDSAIWASSEFACRNDCRSAALGDCDSSSQIEKTFDLFELNFSKQGELIPKSAAKVLQKNQIRKFFEEKMHFCIKKVRMCCIIDRLSLLAR